jgi:hypothetical protein
VGFNTNGNGNGHIADDAMALIRQLYPDLADVIARAPLP